MKTTLFDLDMDFYHNAREDQTFFVRANFSDSTIDHLLADVERLLPETTLTPAAIASTMDGDGPAVETNQRRLKRGSLPLSFWGSLILKSAVLEANDRCFNLDLTGWAEEIEYLRYGEGDHYNSWHMDTMKSRASAEEIRKLTVVLSLSDPEDYEGGEFRYYSGRQGTSLKFQKGEIAIFPACLMHRVTPVKKGVRKMLIGWYGGPPFK